MRSLRLISFLLLGMILMLPATYAQTGLFVTGGGPGNLNAGDQVLLSRMQNLGVSVTVKGGNDPATTADATGKDFVLISATVISTNIDTMFRNVAQPVIVSESFLFPAMGMTGPTNHVDFGNTGGVSQLEILNSGSPFVQPFSGTISVTTNNTHLRWGLPAPSADLVARIAGNPTEYALFYYETGDSMVGLTAPGPRVGLFFENNTASHATQSGLTIFDNIIQFFLTTPCTAATGTLKVNQKTVQISGGTATISATLQGNQVIPQGFTQLFVLTTGNNLTIQQTNSTPSFQVSSPGTYSVHSIVYDPNPTSANFLDVSGIVSGTTTLIDVLLLVNSSGVCAAVDLGGDDAVAVNCTADAGTLTIDQDPVQLSGGQATVSATPDGNINVPAGFSQIFVLTSGPNLVIEQVAATPSFVVTDSGDYTIHTLVYDADPNSPDFLDLSIVQFGVTTGVDVLTLVTTNGLCASLDVAGAPVHVNPEPCTADAGTLTIDQDPVQLSGGQATVSATPDGNINVPAGFSQIFVLTSGPNLVIEQVAATPSFVVTDSGDYTIHTLVYDADPNSPDFLDLSVVQFGVTTGVDVLTLVTTNGLCASLDVAGAPVHVNPEPCTADAGTLTIDQDPVQLSGGQATVSATPDGNINVPAGFSQIFVLTSGPNLVIEQVAATPSFVVTDSGDYTIHTLVYDADPNSPDFLDLSVVQFGVTTGVDVLTLVTTNGLCASLDVAGAPVHVNPEPCTADAGTLTIDQDPVQLSGGQATVSATPDGNINVPAGFSQIFVLTSGPNLVIEQVAATPSFVVTDSGDYTIHTLVYDADPNSPDFLDLSVVQFGVTTGVDVLTLVTTNGLCASLDVAGAPVHVNPEPCTADAGTLTIDQDPVQLSGGQATVSATPDGNINVPAGFSQIFVLTSGPNLVIEQVAATPSFVVTDSGDYTIHTLVYDADPNSPDFLDLSVVQFGVTTGVDVLTLVTTNGLCASLDVAGAPVHVNPQGMSTLTMFPNPTNNISWVSNTTTQDAILDINVSTLQGQKVMKMTMKLPGGSKQSLDLSDMPEGMYMIQVQNLVNGENHEIMVVKY